MRSPSKTFANEPDPVKLFPVIKDSYVASEYPAPTTNLSLRSGDPLVPSHNCQPVGIVDMVPDHIIILPVSTFPLPPPPDP